MSLAFLPLYCGTLGYTPLQIALVAAADNMAVIGAWQLLHRAPASRCAPRTVFFLAALLSLVAFIPLFWLRAFLVFFIFWLVCVTFAKAPMVLAESAAIKYSLEGRLNYGQMRVWGSIGFIVLNLLMGIGFDRFGPFSILVFAAVMLGCVCVAAAQAKTVIGEQPVAAATDGSEHDVKTDKWTPQLLTLAAIVFITWFSTALYYTYFSIYLHQLGWNGTAISATWAIAVTIEVFIYLNLTRIEARYSLIPAFRISILFTALRWLMLGATGNSLVILLTQTFHGFLPAVFLTLSMKIAHLVAPGRSKHTAVTAIIGIGSGLGLLSGRICWGVLMNICGVEQGMRPLLLASGLLLCSGWVLSFRLKNCSAAADESIKLDELGPVETV